MLTAASAPGPTIHTSRSTTNFLSEPPWRRGSSCSLAHTLCLHARIVLLHISGDRDTFALPPTCAYAEVHRLLLLPPLDAGVLLLQGVDVGVHPLHHHAVDGCLVLRLGSSSRRRGSHRPRAQLADVALLRSLLCGAGGRKSVNWGFLSRQSAACLCSSEIKVKSYGKGRKRPSNHIPSDHMTPLFLGLDFSVTYQTVLLML